MIKRNQNQRLKSPEKNRYKPSLHRLYELFCVGFAYNIGNSTFFCTFVPEFIRKLAKRLLYLFHILRKI